MLPPGAGTLLSMVCKACVSPCQDRLCRRFWTVIRYCTVVKVLQLNRITGHRYVYQKPYVEFFCSPDNFKKLREKLDAAPTVTYMAVNAEGEQHMNVQPSDVNAVTWGVFPAKEIVQPTVVDPQSFSIWKVRR